MEEKLFWSSGKDGKIKQWDAIKFNKIQTLNSHSAEISSLALTTDGTTLVEFLNIKNNLTFYLDISFKRSLYSIVGAV